jgi:hypothetical protein
MHRHWLVQSLLEYVFLFQRRGVVKRGAARGITPQQGH